MFISFSHILKQRLTTFFFIFLLLGGCGQIPSSPQISKRSDPPLVGRSVDFDLGRQLHVYSASGFVCHVPTQSPVPSSLPGALVFRSAPGAGQTYDQGTLQTAKNYVAATLQTFAKANSKSTPMHVVTLPYPPFSADPNTFQLLAAGDVHEGCSETLQVTNISKTQVKISQISVRYMADTQTVHQQYDLIDACSLLTLTSPCVGPYGGGENVYYAEIDLRMGKANTTILAQPFTNDIMGPGTPILKPGDIVEVAISYMARNNLSFSLIPSFTLDSSEMSGTYPAAPLQASFALASQFPCYRLQHQRFIQASSGLENTGLWCV